QLESRSAKGPVVLVKPGNSVQEIEPNVYVMDFEREEQFLELVEILAQRSQLPRVVLHHSLEARTLEDTQEVARQLQRGIYALLYLCRALMKQAPHTPLQVLSVFSRPEDAPAPLASAVGGFLRTLTLEHPRYAARVVDIQADRDKSDVPVTEKAKLIWDELCDPDWTTKEVRYRHRVDEGTQAYARYLRELVPYTPGDSTSAALPLRQRGVYLITGGMGGLGFIFGEYLARHFQSRLILVGRS